MVLQIQGSLAWITDRSSIFSYVRKSLVAVAVVMVMAVVMVVPELNHRTTGLALVRVRHQQVMMVGSEMTMIGRVVAVGPRRNRPTLRKKSRKVFTKVQCKLV